MAMEYIGPSAPAICVPWNSHDIRGSGFPSGMHTNSARLPRATEILAGRWRIEGESGEEWRRGSGMREVQGIVNQ